MAVQRIRRWITLSLVDYLDPLITAKGYDFSFVSEWKADKEIVHPDDYYDSSNQIKLPAGNFTFGVQRSGAKIEMGGTSVYRHHHIQLFIHAISEGQRLDLLDYIQDFLGDSGDYNIIDINDYSTTGWPTASPVKLCDMEITDVVSRPNNALGEENLALRYAGMVSFLGTIVKS